MSKNYYDKNAECFITDTANVDMTEHYEKFLHWIPKGGSIIDAGCGSGRDTLAFEQMGYDVRAFDASVAMVEATRTLATVPTYQMTFQNCAFDELFDGIWACASLLHVPRLELSMALSNLSSAVKVNGIIYASFKYGETERHKGDRYFNDQTENTLFGFVDSVSCLKIVETWATGDVRVGRSEEKWLNCIIQKVLEHTT